jgi:hypothetical protein
MEKIMFKKILTAFVMLLLAASAAFAQVDVNKGDQAALDSIKGIGPKISQTIVDERTAHGAYKDWADFEKRVKGIGDKKAAALSQAGLTVNGQSMSNAPMPSTGAGKKDASPASSTATGTSKARMQTDSAKNSGTRESNAVTQDAATSTAKSSAQPSMPAKSGQPTSNVPTPAGTPATKAAMPMSGSASGEGKMGMRTEPSKKSNAKEAESLTQNPATAQGKPATPAAPAAK